MKVGESVSDAAAAVKSKDESRRLQSADKRMADQPMCQCHNPGEKELRRRREREREETETNKKDDEC